MNASCIIAVWLEAGARVCEYSKGKSVLLSGLVYILILQKIYKQRNRAKNNNTQATTAVLNRRDWKVSFQQGKEGELLL